MSDKEPIICTSCNINHVKEKRIQIYGKNAVCYECHYNSKHGKDAYRKRRKLHAEKKKLNRYI